MGSLKLRYKGTNIEQRIIEVLKRLNRHFNENEEETFTETDQSDKSRESRGRKSVLTEGSSNINSHCGNAYRENERNKFDSKTDSVILPITKDTTVHQDFLKESNTSPDKKNDEHKKESKEIRTSKEERGERRRSNNWHKSESHDSKNRSYSRHTRRERQSDFISSSRVKEPMTITKCLIETLPET